MGRINNLVTTAPIAHRDGAGTNYVVKTIAGTYYLLFVDTAGADLYFRKSTDGGKTWGAATLIFTGTVTAVAVWYDRWSNISAGLIHLAYTESGTDDTRYRSINTENSDSLSSETTIFAGTSTANGGALSITRARGGNLYCKTMIDAGVEGGFFRSTDVGATWGSRTDTEALSTTDQWILVPGFAADNQDIMCIFWDASADEISRYVHDDSANSWAETTISGAGAAVDVAATTSHPHFAAAVDLTNSQILVAYWTAVDLANADLLFWTVTESTITAKTDVVTNSTDDQGLVAVGIDTDTQDWYVFYGGNSDGSETWSTAVGIYYKKSTDDGSTWGSQTELLNDLSRVSITQMFCTPRFNTRSAVSLYLNTQNLVMSVDEPAVVQPTYALGI